MRMVISLADGVAVCAVVAEHRIVCLVKRVGVSNEFGHSGPAEELLRQFGLCGEHIAEVAQKVHSK